MARSLDLPAGARSIHAVLVAPLLVESGLANYRGIIDRLLVVDCLDESRIEPTMRRSRLASCQFPAPRSQVQGILAGQPSHERRIASVADVVDNAGGPEPLDAQVTHPHRRYPSLAARKAAVRDRA